MYSNVGLGFNTYSAKGTIFQSILIIIASFAAIVLLFDEPKNGYNLLSLLPVSYIVLAVVSRNCWVDIPINFGLTVLFSLEFIRLVISPLLVSASDYQCVIWYQCDINNVKGIGLLVFEACSIALALKIKTKIKIHEHESIDLFKANRQMNMLMLIIVIITIFVCAMAPETLSSYRTIVGVFTDSQYTTVEGIQLSAGVSTSGKFFAVTGNYILKVVRLLLPAYLLVVLRNKLAKRYTLICYCVILSPLLFVDGTIGRSIYYTIFLLMLYYHLYGKDIKKMIIPISLAGIFVLVYFTARYLVTGGTNALLYFTEKSIDYFAGANIVGGVFNLPKDIGLRIHYHLYDLLRSVPYANTIFGLDSSDYLQRFFNICNRSDGGQIPPTIAMSSYYLSPVFAPTYSIIFTRLCKYYGEKAVSEDNPYYRLIYIYISFITAMGICMYSIDITLITLAQVILPIYLVIRFSYKRLNR